MNFPDSSKKAPNVFVGVSDDTGAPALVSTVRVSGTTVVNVTPSPPPPAPVVDFIANPVEGFAPLTVSFIDQSTNSPTSWLWDFKNDGTATSTLQNPVYQYTDSGIYTVKLTAINSSGSGSETKLNYINVTSTPPCVPVTYTKYLVAAFSNGFRASSAFGALVTNDPTPTWQSIGPGFDQSLELINTESLVFPDLSGLNNNEWDLQQSVGFGTYVMRSLLKASTSDLVPNPLGETVTANRIGISQPSYSEIYLRLPAGDTDKVWLRSDSYSPGDPALGGANKAYEVVIVVGPTPDVGDIYKIISTPDGINPGVVSVERSTEELYDQYGVSVRCQP